MSSAGHGNRLVSRLTALRERGGRALAPYLTAGDGGSQATLAVLRALDRPDVASVELGLPFSDPLADGPLLAAAARRALDAGATFESSCAIVRRLRDGDDEHPPSELPLAVMSYANVLLRRGWEGSAAALAEAGVDAVLVPDLPPEEGADFAAACRARELCPIFFVAPSTDERRLAAAVAASSGFLYAIGRFGVTGAATTFDRSAQEFLARVRAAAGELPVAVGFGIGDAAAVTAACLHADLAIVGSALVDRLHRGAVADSPAERARLASDFLDDLALGLPR